MKYLSWLLPSKEKRFFVLVLVASVRKVFFSFWLGDLRHFTFPTGGPIMTWGCVFCKDYPLNLLLCTTPLCSSARALPGVALAMQLLLPTRGQSKMKAQWWTKCRNATFLHICCSLWLRVAWGSTWAVSTGGSALRDTVCVSSYKWHSKGCLLLKTHLPVSVPLCCYRQFWSCYRCPVIDLFPSLNARKDRAFPGSRWKSGVWTSVPEVHSSVLTGQEMENEVSSDAISSFLFKNSTLCVLGKIHTCQKSRAGISVS